MAAAAEDVEAQPLRAVSTGSGTANDGHAGAGDSPHLPRAAPWRRTPASLLRLLAERTLTFGLDPEDRRYLPAIYGTIVACAVVMFSVGFIAHMPVLPVLFTVTVAMSMAVQCIRACSDVLHDPRVRGYEETTRPRRASSGPESWSPARAAGRRVIMLNPADPGQRAALAHLALMAADRDFTAEDYERLLALDDGPTATSVLAGAAPEELSELPTFVFKPSRRSSLAGPPAAASGAGSAAGAAAAAGGGGAAEQVVVSLPPSIAGPVSGAAAQPAGGDASSGAARPPTVAALRRDQPLRPRTPLAALTAADVAAAAASSPASSRDTCSICLERYGEGERLRILPCLHSFHCDCIDTWLQMKASCPVCKCSIRDPVWRNVV